MSADLRRERIGMMFLNIDASRIAAALVVGRLHDARSQQSARPWPPNDRRKGRKGRKPPATIRGPGFINEIKGLSTPVRRAEARRKLAQTGGNLLQCPPGALGRR
jgi:hypothetical protein